VQRVDLHPLRDFLLAMRVGIGQSQSHLALERRRQHLQVFAVSSTGKNSLWDTLPPCSLGMITYNCGDRSMMGEFGNGPTLNEITDGADFAL
jgi:hypothetical protein